MEAPPPLEQMVEEIDEVVSIPMVTQQVIAHSREKKATANSLARIISKDPVLSSKVLRAANSSLFGFLFKTTDIKSAVVRLGIKQVRNIATAMGVGLIYKGPRGLAGYSRVNVWEHSVAVGIMSEMLAKRCRIREAKELAGEALLAGLLHDIGIILLEQQLTRKFSHIIAYGAGEHIAVHRSEFEALGYDHTDIADRVLKIWRMPSRIIDAVSFHHEKPDNDNDLLVHLTQMAEIMGSATEVGFCDLKTVNREHFQLLQDKLGLVGKPLIDIKAAFDKKIAEALEIFEVGD
ncbi:MAG: HDOD domain-containing protein [Planctomycetota bacterium]|jgi:HD-like signal output (HDOD) protein